MWTASFIPGYLWDNGPKNIKKLTQLENRIEERNYFMKLTNLTIDTYKYGNTPPGCNPRFIEMMNVLNGWSCMARRKSSGMLKFLGFMPRQWNEDGEPVNGTNFGFFGAAENMTCYVKDAPMEGVDGVVCRCNTMNYPMINYITVTARRLADTKRTMDVIRKQLKSPFIVSCAETQVPTAERIFNKAQENDIYIIGSNMLDREAFNVLQTGVQGQNIEILQQYFDDTLNEFLRLIGIRSATNTDKKERLVVPEATSEFAITNDFIDMGLATRKEFIENCNRVFGTNMTVDVNETREYYSPDELFRAFSGGEEGGEENEIS